MNSAPLKDQARNSTTVWRAADTAHHLHPFTDFRGLASEGGSRIITKAEGVWLEDSEGERIIDGMAGLWCVNVGHGRTRIADAIEAFLSASTATAQGPLVGRRALVTSGPTHEPIDPVRYVGNRSSGRMGYAIAQAAWRRGARVTLVSGPSSLDPPFGVEHVGVETAREMHDAVAARIGDADVSVFAAAVADFRPADPADRKMKRAETGPSLTVPLEENPDVARDTRQARKSGSVTVGFALETDDLLANARRKLESKGFDLLVANDATEEGAGFGVPTNRVTILSPGGGADALPLQSKEEVAEALMDRIEALLRDGAGERT